MKFLPYSNSMHKYKPKRKVNKLRIIEIVVVLLFLVTFFGMLYENISSHKMSIKAKGKGKYVSINEKKIYYDLIGHGKATIILESDIGADHLEWSKLVKSMPKNFRVFYYDRAGYGLSEGAGKDVSIEDEVKDLSDILYKGAVNGPYIFVGNSYGSLLANNFAKMYPNEVIGSILINPILENDLSSKETQKDLKKQIRNKSVQETFSSIGSIRILNNINVIKIRNDITSLLSEENAEVFNSFTVSKKYLKAYKEELNILKDYNLDLQQQGMLGDKPLVILLSENKGDEYIKEASKLAQLSSKSEVKVLPNINNIPLEDENSIIFYLGNILKDTDKLSQKE
ncbi:alpha/beta hydrolase [Clostridium algidicarnis]|uniref:alpha/beta hydrolase n=1 Tax=Clostridium algidicarnis TaxID=37659 RepID=UPI001C0E8C1A|nr:alpha/beta hydrolase [Clostridium algidicarnis]MBU3202582.1 alpha/beta hydrolase [Clostridium algidicarnis]MBU3210736.1 alpha/beta hydrolase [Clostridium algidicarnis]MBU3222756.1 alpha/beta hydrolase [Clostridium algidicarnis]